MTKRHGPVRGPDTAMDLSHLRREARTALELAVVALVPEPLLNRLAACTGLLEALSELPDDTPPIVALVPRVVRQTREALADWQKWQSARLPKAG